MTPTPSQTTNLSASYVGRYAPTPSGALHLGNLQTALIAWLHARLNGGRFLLRIDDLDAPRVVAGSAEQIIEDLIWLGIDWDGEVEYQSKRTALYEAALNQIERADRMYPCFCSRKTLRASQSANQNKEQSGDWIYPQTCRHLSASEQTEKARTKPPALRFKTQSGDALQDDFVIKRADGIYAYQLASAVDDAEQRITHVVRGADLIGSTAYQATLIAFLYGREHLPTYWFTPLLTDSTGVKLSKRDGSESVASYRAKGWDAPQLIAKLAGDLNLIADGEHAVSSQSLLQNLSLAQIEQILANSPHSHTLFSR